jgi:hypothetical protein
MNPAYETLRVFLEDGPQGDLGKFWMIRSRFMFIVRPGQWHMAKSLDKHF